jgi:hypothetical protein
MVKLQGRGHEALLINKTIQISGYLADTWNAQEKMNTTTIRKVFTCGAYMGQVGIRVVPI